jgi:hypothetical protein
MTTAAASAPALDDRGQLDRPATLEVHDHAHIAEGHRPPGGRPPSPAVAHFRDALVKATLPGLPIGANTAASRGRGRLPGQVSGTVHPGQWP